MLAMRAESSSSGSCGHRHQLGVHGGDRTAARCARIDDRGHLGPLHRAAARAGAHAGITEVRGPRSVAALRLLLTAGTFAGWFVGHWNYRFLTCHGCTVAGDDLPANCGQPHPGPTTPMTKR